MANVAEVLKYNETLSNLHVEHDDLVIERTVQGAKPGSNVNVTLEHDQADYSVRGYVSQNDKVRVVFSFTETEDLDTIELDGVAMNIMVFN